MQWDRTVSRDWVDEPWFLGFLDRRLVSTETTIIIAPHIRIFAASSEEHSSCRGGLERRRVATPTVSWILSALEVWCPFR